MEQGSSIHDLKLTIAGHSNWQWMRICSICRLFWAILESPKCVAICGSTVCSFTSFGCPMTEYWILVWKPVGTTTQIWRWVTSWNMVTGGLKYGDGRSSYIMTSSLICRFQIVFLIICISFLRASKLKSHVQEADLQLYWYGCVLSGSVFLS